MKTKAVRLYGKNDLRLEEFELPEIKDNEILASVITDSVCMSTLKLVRQGAEHKKAPDDLAQNPVIVGHEFCGEIKKVGAKWSHKYKEGDKYVIQANLQLPDRPDCPGYTYPYTGGDATYIVIDNDIMQQDCLISYEGESFFEGSLLEPLSCVIGAFETNYHMPPSGHRHLMGIRPDGNLLIMAGTGPMGLLAIDYALHGPVQPKRIVVTDHHQDKLDRAKKFYPSQNGTEVIYVNTTGVEDEVALLREATDGEGFDDILIMAAAAGAVRDASLLTRRDACINFFAGPQNKDFMAEINFYDIHYSNVHYVGNSGGSADDMRKAVQLVEDGKIQVANIVTHVLGLDAAADTTVRQKEIGGAKKVIYTHKDMTLTALSDVPFDSPLGNILAKTDGVWSKEAEDYILQNQQEI